MFPKICIDQSSVLPEHLRVRASRLAIEENSSNIPFFRPLSGFGIDRPSPLAMALLTGKKWKNGRTLTVHFMDGHPTVQDKVKEFAGKWAPHANIKLNFVEDPNADIRISFDQLGSWSYLGTDNLAIPKNQPTMNFGWFNPGTPDEEFERTTVHEFGHCLGCIHEHQHPAAGINWNKEQVYDDMEDAGWTREQVDHNLFRKYDRDLTNASVYDPDSIMHYPIDTSWTLDNFSVGLNTELSQKDKEFIKTCYPKDPKPDLKLKVDGPPVEDSIGKHGEEDVFEFKITEPGTYKLQTEGRTDVVMVLLGPNDQTTLIDQDDDSGNWLNAQIVADLQPETYFAKVRHWYPKGTGKYKVALTTVN